MKYTVNWRHKTKEEYYLKHCMNQTEVLYLISEILVRQDFELLNVGIFSSENHVPLLISDIQGEWKHYAKKSSGNTV